MYTYNLYISCDIWLARAQQQHQKKKKNQKARDEIDAATNFLFGNEYYVIKICLFDINILICHSAAALFVDDCSLRVFLVCDYAWMRPLFKNE